MVWLLRDVRSADTPILQISEPVAGEFVLMPPSVFDRARDNVAANDMIGDTDERQPGWTVFRRRRPVMYGENPPNDILINRCSESQIDLLGDLRTSPCRIAPLH